jgi:molybdenum cofactor sulfurtransferase
MTSPKPAPNDASIERDFGDFVRRHPGYEAGADLDASRPDDFARLDRSGDVYLDYTGAGLYPESHVREHAELLTGQVFGNPHSTNPTSRAMTELAESARRAVLAHFRADPDEYVAIFTPTPAAR